MRALTVFASALSVLVGAVLLGGTAQAANSAGAAGGAGAVGVAGVAGAADVVRPPDAAGIPGAPAFAQAVSAPGDAAPFLARHTSAPTYAVPFLAQATPAPAQDGPEPGPELDPQTEADAAKSQNKLVVGLAAAALLGIVIWGRHVRNKRTKGK